MSAAVQPAETAPLPPPVAWILSIRATDKLVAADLATRGNFCFGAILPWQAHAAGASLTFQYASDLYGLDAIIDGVSLTFRCADNLADVAPLVLDVCGDPVTIEIAPGEADTDAPTVPAAGVRRFFRVNRAEYAPPPKSLADVEHLPAEEAAEIVSMALIRARMKVAKAEDLAAAAEARSETAETELAVLKADELPEAAAEKRAAALAEFNARFIFVNEAGKATIFAPRHDHVLNRRCIDRMDTGDLAKLYMNRTVPSGADKHGNVVYEPVAPWWLKHPKRRQFIAGVKFDPTGKREPGVYNLWQGFAVNPQPGDWTMMREHIQHVVCGNDAARFNYLMGWMARMFQDPASRGEVAVVMKGLEGTGKGTLANALAHIIGQHAMAISNAKHLVGNFNSHLQDCLFLFADEAFFAGDKAHTGVLKSLITEPHLTIEGKYRNAILARNYLHVMMASNETWVVPASLEARRFFVLDVTDDCRGQHEYFTAMQAQMEAGGYAAMLHELMAYDLSDFNVRAVPETEALQQQKVLSLNGPDGWWLDVLHRGYVLPFGDGLNSAFEWVEEFTTDSLYRDYCDYAEHRREWRVLPRETLGRFLKRMGGQSVRISVGNHRPMGYRFGALEAARAAFTQSTGLTQDWEAEAN